MIGRKQNQDFIIVASIKAAKSARNVSLCEMWTISPNIINRVRPDSGALTMEPDYVVMTLDKVIEELSKLEVPAAFDGCDYAQWIRYGHEQALEVVQRMLRKIVENG